MKECHLNGVNYDHFAEAIETFSFTTYNLCLSLSHSYSLLSLLYFLFLLVLSAFTLFLGFFLLIWMVQDFIARPTEKRHKFILSFCLSVYLPKFLYRISFSPSLYRLLPLTLSLLTLRIFSSFFLPFSLLALSFFSTISSLHLHPRSRPCLLLFFRLGISRI